MSALKFWVWLAECRGVSNQARLALLRHFGSPEDVYYADTGEIMLTEGITREQAKALESGRKPFSSPEPHHLGSFVSDPGGGGSCAQRRSHYR